VLLIVRYGRLKEQLANNYLLGTDQYPKTLEIATRILGNYQGTRPYQFGEQKSKGGVLVFIQKEAAVHKVVVQEGARETQGKATQLRG
jgi:hypothetical protein